jgi:hypothetical protein
MSTEGGTPSTLCFASCKLTDALSLVEADTEIYNVSNKN